MTKGRRETKHPGKIFIIIPDWLGTEIRDHCLERDLTIGEFFEFVLNIYMQEVRDGNIRELEEE